MIVTIITIIIEFLLMIGVCICFAHCSGYISLGSTVIDKGKNNHHPHCLYMMIIVDVIAALLASIITAISIMFYNIINYLLGKRNDHSISFVMPVFS